MSDPDETKRFAGFGFLLHPPLWCGAEPTEWTRAQLTESVCRERLRTGLDISVTREGLVLIDFDGWSETSKADAVRRNDVEALMHIDERRVAVANAFLVCLHTALATTQEMAHHAQVVTPTEVLHVTDIGLSEENVLFFDQKPLSALVSAVLGGAALQDQATRMLIVDLATLRASFGLLDELLEENGLEGARTAALLLRAVKAAEDEEYGLALIIGWSLCEQMISSLWIQYLQRQGASRARIAKLQQRDWTASVITEALSIAKELTDEDYVELNSVRKARNRWAHELGAITQDEAHRVVILAGKMLRSVGRFSFVLRPWPRGSTTP
jgi:hypothetical protein